MMLRALLILLPLGLPMTTADRPNILFIAVDDLNDWAGYRGHKDAITPNMDRLARQSTWFTRAQCQYPLCGPSRASIMSGMFYHTLNLKELQAKDKDVAKASRALGSSLMHAYFKKHGYKTMAVGKILHRHIDKENIDLSGGREKWDTYRDAQGNRKKINWPSNKTLTDWDIWKGKESDLSDWKAARWAVERLGEKHDKPFMLMVGFLHPHVPWYAPKEDFDRYDKEKLTLPPYRKDDFDDIPEEGRNLLNDGYPRTEWAIQENKWRDIVHAYLANITFVDRQIGKVLDALEKSPYADNTIIVLWGDHGYHLGEKNTFQKDTLWNRSAQAPLMIKAPAVTTGKRCDRVVSLMDLYPTLVDLCELPENKKLQGRSLKPLLNDPEQSWDYPAFTFRKDNGRSLQYNHWRYIEYGDGSMELYDHRKDPNEWTNLASNSDYKPTIEKLKRFLMKAGG